MSVDDKTKSRTIVSARGGGAVAEVELEYWWASDGSSFSIHTLRVRASDNGRSSGNIKMALVSAVDTGWKEMNNDDGIQDGQWHALDKNLSVAGKNQEATIHFNWVYDQKFPNGDINMTGSLAVRL
jgi:hypothetical protein